MSLFVCPQCENTFSTGSVFKNFLFSRPTLTKKVKCADCRSILKPESHARYGKNLLFSSSVIAEIFWYLLFLAGGFLIWHILSLLEISYWWFLLYVLFVIIGSLYQLLEGRDYDVLKKQ